jgi:hypothetical protein
VVMHESIPAPPNWANAPSCRCVTAYRIGLTPTAEISRLYAKEVPAGPSLASSPPLRRVRRL